MGYMARDLELVREGERGQGLHLAAGGRYGRPVHGKPEAYADEKCNGFTCIFTEYYE